MFQIEVGNLLETRAGWNIKKKYFRIESPPPRPLEHRKIAILF